MGLYDRDYMRADRGERGAERRFERKGKNFPTWIIVVAAIVVAAFLFSSC